MSHRLSIKWILAALAVFATAVLVGGCGDSSSSVSPSPSVSAADLVAQSWDKTREVKSATFDADASLRVEADKADASSSAEKALLAEGVTMRVKGSAQASPVCADASLRLALGEQTLTFGVRSVGGKTWLQYEGTWYALGDEIVAGLSPAAGASASPSAQLESLGLGPQAQGVEYVLVGTETLGDVEVHHIKATIDPSKAVDALFKAAQNLEQGKQLGSGQAEQLEQALSEGKEQADALKRSIAEIKVEYWIGVGDLLMRKVAFSGRLVPKGLEGMESVDAMALKAVVRLGGFNEEITVTPPAKARRAEELLTEVLGGMMTGEAAGTGA